MGSEPTGQGMPWGVVLGALALAACGRIGFDDLGDGGSRGDALAIAPLAPTLNVSSALTFTASGGTPPYTFSIASGRGTLDATTGAFFSPTAHGTATIVATDADGQTATTTASFGGSQVFVLGGITNTQVTTVRTSSNGITWTQLTPGLPAPRDSGAAVVFRDAIYYLGGDDGVTGVGTSTVWRSTDGATFQSVGQLPRNGMSMAAVVFNEEIWVLGGYDGTNVANVYASPDGVTWTAEAALPTGRHESVAYAHEDLYLVGGHDASGFLRTVARFDHLAGAWSNAGQTNVATDFQSGAEVGGFILHGSGSGSVALDRSTDFVTWTACAPLPVPMERPGIVDLDGDILVIGLGKVYRSTDCMGWSTSDYPEILQRSTAVTFTPR